MVKTSVPQSDQTTIEPPQVLSKTALTKKYVAVIAFIIGGRSLWTLYPKLSGPLTALQLVMIIGCLTAIGLGAWLWPKKLNIINLLSLVILVNVGLAVVVIAFGVPLFFLTYFELIDEWAVEPVTLYGLVITSTAAYMVINIFRAP
ncbi:hypothetical protein SAMN04488518_11376 [Pseudovibrio ascidiaceicola]|uniref:Uncharacterized protein n=1 Tax=Pseudovibrio ascidiaceicola TaxID=285279 RepID=A0A1I4DYQ7_9HYPH|nr:hypothetical protein [Pseudovibrio ascidiaceicola]SFK98712.1 hypothetical protein SAMN04488518_11376 [Pseudovibrio ascidiaceicola]